MWLGDDARMPVLADMDDPVSPGLVAYLGPGGATRWYVAGEWEQEWYRMVFYETSAKRAEVRW